MNSNSKKLRNAFALWAFKYWGDDLPDEDLDAFVAWFDDYTTQQVTKKLLDELKRIEQLDNTIAVPFRENILGEVEQYEDLIYKEHYIYIDDRIAELESELNILKDKE